MIRFDIKKAIFNYRNLIIILGFMIYAYFLGADILAEVLRKGELLSPLWSLEFISGVITDRRMLYIIPIAAALPYAAAFIDEKKSGELKFVLIRTVKKKYIFSKLLSSAMSGGLVLFVSVLILYLFTYYVFFPVEILTEDTAVVTSVEKCLLLCLRYFLVGSIYSLTGSILSLITLNRYIAWSGAFIIEYLLIIVTKRFFKWLYILNTAEWIVESRTWPLKGWSLYIWLVMVLILLGVIYAKLLQKEIDSD